MRALQSPLAGRNRALESPEQALRSPERALRASNLSRERALASSKDIQSLHVSRPLAVLMSLYSSRCWCTLRGVDTAGAYTTVGYARTPYCPGYTPPTLRAGYTVSVTPLGTPSPLHRWVHTAVTAGYTPLSPWAQYTGSIPHGQYTTRAGINTGGYQHGRYQHGRVTRQCAVYMCPVHVLLPATAVLHRPCWTMSVTHLTYGININSLSA